MHWLCSSRGNVPHPLLLVAAMFAGLALVVSASTDQATARSRRQADDSAAAGTQFSIPLPFLKDWGLPQPVAEPGLSVVQLWSRLDSVSLLGGLASAGDRGAAMARVAADKARPILSQSAAAWRHTVDHTLAPGLRAGLEVVGSQTVSGMGRLAETVMGPQAKQKAVTGINQSVGAIGSLAQAAMESVGAGLAPSDYSEETDTVMEAAGQADVNENADVDVEAYPDQLPRREERQANTSSTVQTVGRALYSLGTNLLGQNTTDRLVPMARLVADGLGQVGHGLNTLRDAIPFPSVEVGPSGSIRVKTIAEDEADKDAASAAAAAATRDERDESASSSSTGGRITTGAPRCTTPQGAQGRCMDIQNCPLLLASLNQLRKSICFKSLFVPGVCCPDTGVELVAVDDDLNVVNEVHEIASDASLPNNTGISTSTSTESVTVSEVSHEDAKPDQEGERRNTVPGTDIECGVAKIAQARIVGGNETFAGEFPWMAAIYLHGNGKREFWCGGALISPTRVVTAAHCTRDAKRKPFRASQFSVRLGEWDLSDDDAYSREFRVLDYKAHPDFKPNGFYNDLAVFVLDKPVELNEHIQPICLPSDAESSATFVGTLPVALGWGTTEYGGAEVSSLRGVALPVWSNADCDNAYFQPITEVFLCAGYADGGRDACQGDSGGPLMLYDEQTNSWTLSESSHSEIDVPSQVTPVSTPESPTLCHTFCPQCPEPNITLRHWQ